MISPKNYFSPTWRMTNSSVEIFNLPRGGCFFIVRSLHFPVRGMTSESDSLPRFILLSDLSSVL